MAQPNLSPAAHAVLDAFNDRYELCGPLEDTWHEVSLAAAIRAAVQECAGLPDGRDCTELLRNIATELENN